MYHTNFDDLHSAMTVVVKAEFKIAHIETVMRFYCAALFKLVNELALVCLNPPPITCICIKEILVFPFYRQ